MRRQDVCAQAHIERRALPTVTADEVTIVLDSRRVRVGFGGACAVSVYVLRHTSNAASPTVTADEVTIVLDSRRVRVGFGGACAVRMYVLRRTSNAAPCPP